MAKKRGAKKRALAAELRKRQQSGNPEPAANPFELKQQRRKHDVLGQRVKGVKGNVAAARSHAIKTRKATLLNDFKGRSKAGTFVDKRFGEYDRNMTEEEKMLERFAREKRRAHERSDVFALPDEEEDQMELTHRGQRLGDVMDDYIPSEDDDDDDELLGQESVADLHFGGGLMPKKRSAEGGSDDEPEAKRTHKEIMEEVVKKAKLHKLERQEEKRINVEAMDQLDNEFADVRMLILGESNRAVKEGRVHQPDAVDAYDIMVKELAAEAKKAAATDRLKTPQELAEEERQRLERLEAARLRRMASDVSAKAGQGDEMGVEYVPDGREEPIEPHLQLRPTKDGRMKLTRVGGGKVDEKDLDSDAAESDQDIEAEFLPKSRRSEHSGEENSDSDLDSGEDDSSEEEDGTEEHESMEEGDEGDDGLEVDFDEARFGAEEPPAGVAATGVEDEAADEDMDVPFLFEAQESSAELLDLLSKYDVSKYSTIASRLVAGYNVHLRAENRTIQAKHAAAMLDTMKAMLDRPSVDVAVVNAFVKPLHALVGQIPAEAARVYRERLQDLQAKLAQSRHPAFPKLSEVFFLQTIPTLFPVTDFRHPVTTPALALMGHMLSTCSVTSVRGILVGLYLCTVCYEYVEETRRLVPEVVQFLANVLVACAGSQSAKSFSLPNFAKAAEDLALPKLFVAQTTLTPRRLDLELLQKGVNGQNAKQMRLDVCYACFNLARRFMGLYASMTVASELFDPVMKASQQLRSKCQRLPKSVDDSIAWILSKQESWSQRSRQLLRMQAHRPVPLKMLEPDFEEVNVSKGAHIKDRDKRELQKLKYLHKREMKGAVRELRKDARFLAKVRLEEQLESDQDRFSKMKRIGHILSSERHEEKQLKKLKS